MKNHEILFNIGEESRPVIESGKEILDKSIFTDQYNKAFTEIEDYLKQVDQPSEKESLEKITNENSNNIFAFIGERGSGKTSCMLSVGKVLINKKESDSYLSKYPTIKRTEFHTIDLIDPSFFDNKNNILAIIVAKLFKAFDNETKKRKSRDDYNKKRKLIETFQKTQRNLKCLIEGKKLSEDDLDELIALSAAVDLRTNLYDLVNAYLDYFGNNGSKLVLMVDDIDLHTKHARDMVEQIRKYLIQPNVVILMALKIDQLATVKRLHFTKEFKELLDKERQQLSLDTIDEMVDRYLTKLLPLQHRVFLPEGEVYSPLRLVIVDSERKKDGIPLSFTYNTVREAVLTLIFSKTRYLFYNSREGISRIIPNNLRELRHLVKMLYNMDDYRGESDSDRPEYNKVLFKNYLFETWCSNNLDRSFQLIVKEIINQKDAWKLNKNVIQLLKNRYELDSYIKSTKNDHLQQILDPANSYFNISLGDVLGVIHFIETINPNQTDLNLLFIIKTIYSIRLYEYYDELTLDIKSMDDNPLLREVFGKESFIPLSNYQKLVSGSYVNTPLSNLLPANSTTKLERGYRSVNLQALNDLVCTCLKDDNIDNIRVAEFLMLMISRFIDTKNRPNQGSEKINFTEGDYRTRRHPYYNGDLKNRQNGCFDITSFFYNIVDLDSTYKRFQNGEAFLEKVKGLPESIYCKIQEETKNRTESAEFQKNQWLSWCCIRNIEILEFLTKFLTDNRPHGASNDLKVLKDFFIKIQRFAVETYDFTPEKDGHYKIDFSFVKIFTEVLGSEGAVEVFEQIYGSSEGSPDQMIIESLNENNILKGRKQTNKSKTIIEFIKDNYINIYNRAGFSAKIEGKFTTKYVTKDEIRRIVKELNDELREDYGQS